MKDIIIARLFKRVIHARRHDSGILVVSTTITKAPHGVQDTARLKFFTKDSFGGLDRPSYQYSAESTARWLIILRRVFDLFDLKVIDVPVAAC